MSDRTKVRDDEEGRERDKGVRIKLPPIDLTPQELVDEGLLSQVLAYQQYIRERMQELTRIVAKAAEGDYTDKPKLLELDDELSKFVVGFRFLLDDLEQARVDRERRNKELRAAYDKVAFQAALLARQADASPDGILVVDPDGRMTSFNRRFVEMWGIPPDVIESGSDERAIASVSNMLEDPDEFTDRIAHLYARRTEESREEIKLKDGRVVERYSAPLWSETGDYFGRVWHFRDVTKTKKAQEEIQAAYQRMKELDAMKTRFINTVAHELATPLTPLKLQVHLFRKGKYGSLTKQQTDSVALIDRNLDRLQALIQDVLDVARMESKALRLTRRPIDLNDVVQEAFASFKAQAEDHKVAFNLNKEPGLMVSADAGRIGQVLYNLLSNAFKFTPAGGSIHVETEKAATLATVHVKDTGPGLAEEDFPKLFRPFSQAHDPMEHTKAGSGLGLYISEGIIERHGGRIWCDSAGPGQGATFSFALPLLDGDAAPELDVEPVHESCPACRSHDISRRVIKNKLECNACGHSWR